MTANGMARFKFKTGAAANSSCWPMKLQAKKIKDMHDVADGEEERRGKEGEKGRR